MSDSAPAIDNLITLVDPADRISSRARIHRIGVSGRIASSWYHAWLGTDGPWRTTVVGLAGHEGAGIHRGLGTNAYGVHSATPYLTAPLNGAPIVLVAAVLLTRDALPPQALAEGIDVEVTGTIVRIAFPGSDSAQVGLGG